MGVSRDHERLVNDIVHWIERNHGDKNYRLFVDRVDVLGASKPKKIGGYVPDVLCNLPAGGRAIIGEAKTPGDLEGRHTLLQLEAFMKHLAADGGGLLIVSTTWASSNSAKAILRRVRCELDATKVGTLVIDETAKLRS